MKLGKVNKVDLREIWSSESSDFTPWLAKEENIALLGNAIGLDLEVDSLEKNVGPFRADILALDLNTTHYVLIENQLEQTNHNHLGQIMTYAAGLDACSIIWIAKSFTEEHRAALDWLNRITDENINFFGIEIEVIQISENLEWLRMDDRKVSMVKLTKSFNFLDHNSRPEQFNWFIDHIMKFDKFFRPKVKTL